MTRTTNLAKRATFTFTTMCAVLLLTPTAIALGPSEAPVERTILETLRELGVFCDKTCDSPTPPICEKACTDPVPTLDVHRRFATGNVCVASVPVRSTACASLTGDAELHGDPGRGQPMASLSATPGISPCIPTTLNPCDGDGKTGSSVEEPPSCGFGCGPEAIIGYVNDIISNTHVFGQDARTIAGKILTSEPKA